MNLSANPLLSGNTQVSAQSTATSAFINPAQAAFLKKHHIFLNINPGLLKSNVRLVGQDSIVGSKFIPVSGINTNQILGGIYSINSRFKVGSSIFYPSVSVPSSLIGTQQVGSATLLGQPISLSATDVKVSLLYLNLLASYRITKELSVGLTYNHISANIKNLTLTDELENPYIENMNGDFSKINAKLGFKYVLNKRISLGLTIDFFQKTSAELNQDSLNSLPQPIIIDEGGFGIFSAQFGASYRFNSKLTLQLQADYTPQQATEGFSLVDFELQALDSQDVLGGGIGANYRLNNRLKIIAGASLSPAKVGPGEQGSGSTTGFNSHAMSFLQKDKGAVYSISAGAEFKLLKKVVRVFNKKHKAKNKKRGRKNRRRVKKYHLKKSYPLTVSVGASVSYSSVGIDENGELPAAYQETSITMPISFSYSFQ